MLDIRGERQTANGNHIWQGDFFNAHVTDGAYLAVKVVMMPRDTNAVGPIFGGVLLSYTIGRTSITAHVSVEAERKFGPMRLTEAEAAGLAPAEVHLPPGNSKQNPPMPFGLSEGRLTFSLGLAAVRRPKVNLRRENPGGIQKTLWRWSRLMVKLPLDKPGGISQPRSGSTL